MRTAILRPVLDKIKPGKDEKTVTEVNEFLKKLEKQLKKLKVKAKPILGGSFAKDTWLISDHDVDVFVAFDLKYKDQDMSGLLGKALRPWKPIRIHGSRDYFQIRSKISYEIIPVLAIKKASEAMNVTDFSPKHVSWVNKKGKNLKDDIRLLKKFCKAQRLYGAESYIRGFSGHVVDILVIYYGGFIKLLRASKKWKPKTVLDYNKVYKGKALLVLNESKIQGPLVLIDPMQNERNAAAALTTENYDKFIKAAKSFLAKPSKNFFEEKLPDFKVLKSKGAIIVDAKTVTGKEDVSGAKMVKAFDHIRKELEKHGFKTVDSGWTWKKKDARFWYLTKEKILPKTWERKGPPVKLEENAKAFKKKHRKVKVVKGKLIATIPRIHRTPESIVKHVLKDKYLKDKLVSLKIS